VFTNNGEVTHDAYIGDEGAQADPEEELNGEMGGDGKRPERCHCQRRVTPAS
jgi:hypothetical protein